MGLGRPQVALMLTDDERVHLESLAHQSRTAPHRASRLKTAIREFIWANHAVRKPGQYTWFPPACATR